MDKTAIRNFAIEARKILMKSAITEAGFYGITKDGCKSPTQKGNDFEVYETVAGTENRIFGDDIKRRASLVKAIGDIGFDQVIEETAYTWFNRIIAIRFMEVNNYLPTRVRVLSSETGSGTPDIISQSDTVELNLSAEELDKVQTAKRENRYDDAFRLLFIKQCNELNDILPGLFEKTNDYMELLLKITYTSDGVIRMLVDSIPESNFNVETEGQVEIIGWMYQYYNTELKDDTFAKLKKNVKITKERIPAATQLFTPDWIVRYMVENSLGRVWIEHLRAVDPSVDEKAKAEEFGWKYYLPEAEQEEDVAAQLVEIRKSYKDLAPQDLSCIDPCMGSGHILVYMFDVLMDIYRSEGFSEREAVFDILERNIRGFDIDRRAYQLSYFALMMKARGYNRIFFRGREDIDGNRVKVEPKVYAIEESNSIERDQLQYYGAGLDEVQKNSAINQMNGLLDTLHDAKEYGSILSVENYDWTLLHAFVDTFDNSGQMSFGGVAALRSQILLKKLVDIGETLARKYEAVVTNPPYMGFKGMSSTLADKVTNLYPDSKGDLSTVFMERCSAFCVNSGYYSMINIPVWMFLKSYSKLRTNILKEMDINNMLYFGRGVFGSDFGTTAFTVRRTNIIKYTGVYYKLFDKQGSVEDVVEKEKRFFDRNGEFHTSKSVYYKLPNTPIAYWATKGIIEAFSHEKLSEVAAVKKGMSTAADEKYIRSWFEVSQKQVGKKWFKVTKGGDFRKWYGNRLFYVNWENDGQELRAFPKAVLRNIQYYFHESICWNYITISKLSFKYYDDDFAFTAAAPCVQQTKDLKYILGFANSCVANELIMLIGGATVTFEVGEVGNLPVIYSEKHKEEIDEIVDENIRISKEDWNSFECSRDFQKHPLVRNVNRIEIAYEEWKSECETRFNKLKNNEKRLNDLFLEIYNLEGEIDGEIADEDVTVNKANYVRDIRSFISYAIGCMLGRYSLDQEGLACADGNFDSSRYKSYAADNDNIIPITDEDYFADDIVNRFIDFVKVVYGEEYINDNLSFIAGALGGKGEPKDIIRQYFQNDFYKDHLTIYSNNSGKRPIYWMFDSGKENGFKCLIYLHRYTPDTVGLIRTDYLVRAQNMIENALKNAEYAINSSASAVDKAQATKKRNKYIKQLAEIRAYYPALSHIALQRINLDLDDGVKVNYEKFQNIEVSIEGEKKQKIDLLAKI